MTYAITASNGISWIIRDGVSAQRWALCLKRGDSIVTVASYLNPGAAALAVADGDTGISEWDDEPRRHADFVLSRWQRQSEEAA